MAKTAFYYSKVFLEHDTGAHVENKSRLEAIIDLLESKNMNLDYRDAVSATPAMIELNHLAAYINNIEGICRKGGGWIDGDTVVSGGSYNAALYAAGTAADAAIKCFNGEIPNAFCAVRPPGHHSEYAHAMGFCLFNNVAIAARYLQKEHPESKVFIIDWDAHHGNGTQNSFYESDSVYYVSLHQYPFYPGTGSKNEIGSGKGKGYNINFPLRAGSGDAEFIHIFKEEINPILEKFAPDIILLSAGFDAHEADPLTSLMVTTSGFEELTRIVKAAAERVCGGKIVSLLEGGYNLRALAESVYAHLAVLSS